MSRQYSDDGALLAEGGERRRLPQLDALRGGACLLILVAHLNRVDGLLWIPSSLGVVGIGVFFALSGFLITRGLLAEKSRGGSLNGFFNRRAARILPAYYFLLTILAVVWPGREIGWAATFTFNLFYVTGAREYFHLDAGIAPIPPVAHTWSLCIEEHFYWFWPVVVWCAPARVARWLPAVCVVATPGVTWLIADQLAARNFSPLAIDGLVQRLTPTQLVALSLGCLAAFHEAWLLEPDSRNPGKVPRLHGVIALATIVVAAFWLCILTIPMSPTLQRCLSPTLTHSTCALIFAAGMALRDRPWLRHVGAIGTISYGLYLYHLPIYAALGLATGNVTATVASGATAVTLTFVAAWLSYRWIESPILRHVRRNERLLTWQAGRWTLSAGTVAVLLLGVMAGREASVWLTRHPVMPEHWRLRVVQSPTRGKHDVVREDSDKPEPEGGARRKTDRSFWSHGIFHEVNDEGFRHSGDFPPKPAGVRRIVVVGDSYAFGECVESDRVLSAELQRRLVERGLTVECLNAAQRGLQAEGVRNLVLGRCHSLEPDLIVYAATFSDFLAQDEPYEGRTAQDFREQPRYKAQFRKALRDIRDDCRRRKVPFLAVCFNQFPADAESIRTTTFVESIFREVQVDYAPIGDYLKKNSHRSFTASRFDPHPSAECHRLYSEILAGHLEQSPPWSGR